MIYVSKRRRLASGFWLRVVRDIESIVPVYSRMNKIMSLGLDDKVRSNGLRCADDCSTYVDVGTGPGDSIIRLVSKLDAEYIIGIEPSPRLARIAFNLCRGKGYAYLCDFVVAVAEASPLRANAVDCALAFFSFRDLLSLEDGINEILRFTRRRIVVGDIFVPENRFLRLIEFLWVCFVVPLLAILFTRRYWRNYLSLCKTLRDWLSANELSYILRKNAEMKGIKLRVKNHVYAYGSLGVVVAEKDTSGHNRC